MRLYNALPNAITTGCWRSRRKCKISFSRGEWKPLITTLSVLHMDSAHWRASWASCGVALREAKNATSGLSNKSLFPDKSIKKSAGYCINLSSTQALAALTRISNTDSPRWMIYRTHRANVGGKDIHLTWTSDCVSSCYSNRQVWILKI